MRRTYTPNVDNSLVIEVVQMKYLQHLMKMHTYAAIVIPAR